MEPPIPPTPSPATSDFSLDEAESVGLTPEQILEKATLSDTGKKLIQEAAKNRLRAKAAETRATAAEAKLAELSGKPAPAAGTPTPDADLRLTLALHERLGDKNFVEPSDRAKALESLRECSTLNAAGELCVFDPDDPDGELVPVDDALLAEILPKEKLLSRAGGGSGSGAVREARPPDRGSADAKIVNSQAAYEKLSKAERLEFQKRVAREGGVTR